MTRYLLVALVVLLAIAGAVAIGTSKDDFCMTGKLLTPCDSFPAKDNPLSVRVHKGER